jgi:protein-tyrosine phosphatase
VDCTGGDGRSSTVSIAFVTVQDHVTLSITLILDSDQVMLKVT